MKALSLLGLIGLITLTTPSFAANGGGGGDVGGRPSDQGFLRQSAQIAMMEIAMGQLALSNSRNASVQAFAQQLITDHTVQLEQAQNLASDLGTSLPDTLATRDQRILDRLETLSGEQFDRSWTQLMVTGHGNAFALHQRGAQRSRTEAVRTYARAQLVPLATHLATALEIDEQFRHTGSPTDVL